MNPEWDVAYAIANVLNEKWKLDPIYDSRYKVIAQTSHGFIVTDADRAPYKTFEVIVRQM